MKAILEKAEKVVDLFHTPEEDKAMNQLAWAIIRRRELENTPVTIEWLKVHGWAIQKGVVPNQPDSAIKRVWDGFIQITPENEYFCFDRVYDPYDVEPDVAFDAVRSIANLCDACALCGIEIED